MMKIPTLFVRDPDDRAHVLPDVTPGTEWVLAGEGTPTRKWDGTAVRFDGVEWWARREIRPGKPLPPRYLVAEHDGVSGRTFGWEPAAQSPFSRHLREALDADPYRAGTYELVGPKINGNPEGAAMHVLLPHGRTPLTYLIGRVWTDPHDAWFDLSTALHESDRQARSQGRRFEGIVWWHEDGRRVKVKTRDFPDAGLGL